jgi:hypothetical protein
VKAGGFGEKNTFLSRCKGTKGKGRGGRMVFYKPMKVHDG